MVVIFVKVLLNVTVSGIRLTQSFLNRKDYIARLYSKIAFNISFGSDVVHVQIIQPFLKFPY